MQRKAAFAVDEHYHIYNRGTDKRKIYQGPKDYQRFLVLLHLANNTETVHISNQLYQGRSLMELLTIKPLERLVAIGAYCLMPNHFHLLVREKTDNGITTFMKKLLTGYSMYFNKKYDRTGNLFQGCFKAEHVAADDYLKYLFAYIHLNPIKLIEPGWRDGGLKNKKRAEQFLANYAWSSFTEHCTDQGRPEAVLLERAGFPQYFQTAQDSLEELRLWLSIKDGP